MQKVNNIFLSFPFLFSIPYRNNSKINWVKYAPKTRMFLWNHQPTSKRCQFSKLSLQKRANSDISSFPPPKMLNAAYKNVKLVEMNRPLPSHELHLQFTLMEEKSSFEKNWLLILKQPTFFSMNKIKGVCTRVLLKD